VVVAVLLVRKEEMRRVLLFLNSDVCQALLNQWNIACCRDEVICEL